MALLAFPRSFVFSQAEIPPIEGIRSHSLPIGSLAISSETEWRLVSRRGFLRSSHLLLIGTAFELRHPDRSSQEIAERLLRAGCKEGIDAMLKLTEDLFGRYLAIARIGQRIIAFNDAAATRSTYYTDYGGGIALASHATLLGQIFHLNPRRSIFGYFQFGTPANESIYPGVSIMLPNFSLCLRSGTLVRFWPRSERESLPLAEAVDRAERLIVTSAECVSSRWDPVISLTAGLDSRLTLAAFRGLTVSTFTYCHEQNAKRDVLIAGQIAAALGLPHKILDTLSERVQPPNELAKMPEYSHIRQPLTLMRRHFSDPRWMHVRSNVAEVGRAFWRKMKSPPSAFTPSVMSDMISRAARRDEAGADAAQEYAKARFASFKEVLGYETDADGAPILRGYDAWDLYYWEHRMPTWHGPLILGTDLIFDTLTLFNSRALLTVLLSVPLSQRKEGAIFREIIRRRLPALQSIPINPPRSGLVDSRNVPAGARSP